MGVRSHRILAVFAGASLAACARYSPIEQAWRDGAADRGLVFVDGSTRDANSTGDLGDGGVVGPSDANNDGSVRDNGSADALSRDMLSSDTLLITYSWMTGSWSSCSRTCDGGTQTRPVWCESSTGQTVADALCSGAKPSTSRSCNTQPCCTTDTMQQSRRCNGTAQSQATNWGSNTGSSADRASCASNCSTIGKNNGWSSWCCELYEDSGPGTNWVCRTYVPNGIYAVAEVTYFASQGRCNSP